MRRTLTKSALFGLALLFSVSCLGTEAAYADTLNGLVGWWQFNGNGSDSSGHGFNLSLVGNPSFAPGLFGQEAISLDGTGNQYAVRPIDDAAFNFGSSDFTVLIWANFADHSHEETLIEKFTGSGGPGWTFTTRGDLQFFPMITSGAVSYPTGQWHLYVAERQGNQVFLFIDGNLIASGNFSGALTASTNPLLIGRRNPQDTRNFAVNGLLQDAAIWNRALSQAEINSLFQNGFPVPEPASVWLLLAGLAGFGSRAICIRRRFGKRP